MVEAGGPNREASLRQENRRLTERIKSVLFTHKTMNEFAILDPQDLLQLIARSENPMTKEVFEVFYLPDRIPGVAAPDDFTFPLYRFTVTDRAGHTSYETPYGLLPGEFVDSGDRYIRIGTSYILNQDGQGIRQVEYVNRSASDEQITPEESLRRSNLQRVEQDFAIGSSSVDVFPMNERDQGYIEGILQQYEQGDFSERIFYRQTRNI